MQLENISPISVAIGARQAQKPELLGLNSGMDGAVLDLDGHQLAQLTSQ